VCPECEVEAHFDGVDFDDWHECPDCGGMTSGENVICARCRRGDDL